MTRPFVPWRDDCILPEESVYSAFSKVAWFQSLPPARYLSACRLPAERRYGDHVIAFSEPWHWLSYLQNERVMPRMRGQPLRLWMEALVAREADHVPPLWRGHYLRVCDGCLKEGMHLQLHQHMALSHCHVHATPLRETCRHCQRALRLRYSGKVEAFCCPACGRPLTSRQAFGQPRSHELRGAIHQATEQTTPSLHGLRELQCIDARKAALDRIWPLSMAGLLLEAAYTRIPAHPALRRGHWPQACLRTEAATTGRPTAVATRWGAGAGLAGETFAERLKAARLVAAWFMHQKGRLHLHCLDAPLHMFGEGFSLDAERPEDLLGCCPVAVGFWLWRLSFGHHFQPRAGDEYEQASPADRGVVLLLYKAFKSHLQYCLYVAQRILNSDADLHVTERVSALRRLTYTSFRDFRLVTTRSPDVPVTLVRFDIDHSWISTPCRGYRAYRRRLREQNSMLPCVPPQIPFARMRFGAVRPPMPRRCGKTREAGCPYRRYNNSSPRLRHRRHPPTWRTAVVNSCVCQAPSSKDMSSMLCSSSSTANSHRSTWN